MAKPKLALAKRRGNYYVVSLDGAVVGFCKQSNNPFAASGVAGWQFEPTLTGMKLKLPKQWGVTARRAAEGALRVRSEAGV